MPLPRRSVGLVLGTSVALTGALAGVLVPGPARALFPRRPLAAPSSAPPPPRAIVPVAATAATFIPVPSTPLELDEVEMTSATEGWALTVDHELVRITEGGRKLRIVGPPGVVEASFVGTGGAVVTTAAARGGALGVHRTRDGGSTFTSSQIDVGTSLLRSDGIAFVSPDEGIIVVHEEASNACCGAWATLDGGRSFTRIVTDPTWRARVVGHEVWIGLDDETVLAWRGDGTALASPRGLDACEVELTGALSNDLVRATCDTGSHWFAHRGNGWAELAADEDATNWGFLDARHGFRWRRERSSELLVMELTGDATRTWTRIAGAPSDPVQTVLLDPTTALVTSRTGDAEDGTLDRLWIARDGAFSAAPLVTLPGERISLSKVNADVVYAAVRSSGGTRIYASQDRARTFTQVFTE